MENNVIAGAAWVKNRKVMKIIRYDNSNDD